MDEQGPSEEVLLEQIILLNGSIVKHRTRTRPARVFNLACTDRVKRDIIMRK